MTVLYRLGRQTARLCFNTFGRLDVTGQESVPPYGPLIVVSNHLSFTDPPLLVAGVPRPLHFISKRPWFSGPLAKYAMGQLHVSPFDRSSSRVDAVRTVLGLLDRDQAVVVFPEGHRSPDHTLKEGMLGVVYIAMKSQAPILPVGLTGTEKLRAWRMPVPLCRLSANIGQPFTPPVIEGRPSREVMHSILDMIMGRIAALLPEQYRGVYTDAVSRPAGAPGAGSAASAPTTSDLTPE